MDNVHKYVNNLQILAQLLWIYFLEPERRDYGFSYAGGRADIESAPTHLGRRSGIGFSYAGGRADIESAPTHLGRRSGIGFSYAGGY